MERIGSDTLSQFIFGPTFYLLKLTICSVVIRKYTFIPHSKVAIILILKHVCLSTAGDLDPSWYLDTDQWLLALAPQVTHVKLRLALVLVSVVYQHFPCHLNIHLQTRDRRSRKATENAFVLTSGLSVGTTKLLHSWIFWPGCMSAQLKLYVPG